MSSRQTQSRKTASKNPVKHERVCLLVLGMHRSGTSALTRVMSLLGADLPATLLSGSASNAKGHWESEPIVRLNDEIFKSAGISWRSPEAMPEQWYHSARFDQYRDRAQLLMESEFGRSPLFVLKDPRICKLVPFWLSVLEKAEIKPAIVHIVRSPEEVADSLLKRDELDRHLGMLTWLRYVLRAERDSRTRTRVHLSYDGLLADWQSGAQSISDTFDLHWPSASTERTGQIDGFLSNSERHHRKALEPNSRDDVSSWATQACAIFNSWAENSESASDHPTLDAIADRFNAALEPLLAPLLVSYEKSATVQKLRTIRASQNGELERIKAQCDASTRELSDFRVQRDQANTELDEKTAKLAAQDRELSELASRNEQAKKESAALADRVRGLTIERDSRIDQLDAKEKELSDLGSRITSEMAELNAREARTHDLLLLEKRQLLAAETKLAQVQRVNATLLIIRGRFEAASEDLARLGAEHEDAQKRLNQTERALVDLKTEATERVRDLKKKLSVAQALADSRATIIIDLREDRAAKIGQRDKLQVAVAAMREQKTLQIEQRDNRIKDLSRSVKRLEKKIAVLRALERDVASQIPSPAAAPKWQGAVTWMLRNLIPESERQRLRRHIELVGNSDLFDAEYYRERYKDLHGTPAELLEHYVRYGGDEGRAPSPAFNGGKYLQHYPDVAEAGLNPLVHYLESGRDEGRTAFPVISLGKSVAADVDVEPAAAEVPPIAEETEADGPDTTEFEGSDVSASDGLNNQPAGVASDGLVNPTDGVEIEESSVPAIEPLETGVCLLRDETFSALAIGASDWLRSSEIADIDALRVGGIAVAGENRSAGQHASAALKWFEALSGGSTTDVDLAADVAVRKTLHDGELNIEDAWLSSDYTLRIRLSADSAGALVIRCWQQDEHGSMALCGEQPLIARQSHILTFRLASRFTAILFVVTDRLGGLIDSTLLPFPTLLRGGVHHGELIDHARSSTGWAAHEAYSASLLIALADQSTDFAVGGVSVALGDANGTEPIFSRSFRQWLSRQFEIDVTATVEAEANNPALLILAGQMPSAVSSGRSARRAAGRTLRVGANSIPSLSILLAKAADLADASTLRTIVVDDLTRRPLRAVDRPIIDRGNEKLLQQTFEPPLAPGEFQGAGSTVVSISFNGGAFEDVRAPFPVASDVLSPMSGLLAVDDEPVSAIVTCNGDVDGLTRLLASLARQQSVAAVECLLTGDVPDLPDTSLLLFDADRPVTMVRVEAADAATCSHLRAAVGQATHDRILLIDDNKVLHDPRTLAVLGALCAREEIGTAGCQIVNEASMKKGVVSYRTRAGYAPLRRENRPTMVTCPDAGDLDHAPLHPVLANPIGCLMARRELLSSVVRDLEQNEFDQQPSLALGRAIIECGKLNIATSLLSIFDSNETCVATVAAPWLAAAPTRFIALEEY